MASLSLKKKEGLYSNIKYIAIAANAVLLSIKLNFYFYIFKLYKELFKKLIIAFIIITNIIPNFIKYLVVLKDLPKNLYLLITSIPAK